MSDQINNCSLKLSYVESMELNNPTFEQSGSITIQLLHNTILIEDTSMDPDTLIIQDIHSTLSSKTINKNLFSLCTEQFTAHLVHTMLHSLEIDPGYINWLKPNIVSYVVHKAIQTKHRGFKHFRLQADIEITTTAEVAPEMQSMEEDLERVLIESMEEMSLKQNPASKLSIEKLKRGHFEGGVVVNCGVCLDDIEVGSKVMFMPCSHMFHGGCLLRWLEESNSCPLCRLELPV